MKIIDITSGTEYIDVINGETTCNNFAKFHTLLSNSIDLSFSNCYLIITWNKFNSLNSIGDDRLLILMRLYETN